MGKYFLSRSRRLTFHFMVFVLVIAFFLPTRCLADNYYYTYGLLDVEGGFEKYSLEISVTSSLYEYYRSKEHNFQLIDLGKFVTPSALKPIADDLLSIYSNAEQFANGVLMIVHQIPYKEIGPAKYPVETIVENEGDCDLFSFIAASIMMAGGLDTVLLFYETQNHMNVGVNLPEKPREARSDAYFFTHNEKRYYIAECTGGDWRNGWKVGECPDTLRGETAQIITLDGYEVSAPSQVSSSWDALAPSSLSLEASTRFGVVGRVVVSGFISPTLPGANVTLYASSWGSPFNMVARVVTDDDGRFSYTWQAPSVGLLSIVASWPGDSSLAGADSNVCSLIVVPSEWLMMGGMVIASLIVLLIVRSATRKKTQISEPMEEWELELNPTGPAEIKS